MVFNQPLAYRSLPPAVKSLLTITVAVFALQWLFSFIGGPNLVGIFGLTPGVVTGDFWVWQIVTYMFLHGGPFHLLFNCYMLWALGKVIEVQWGTKSFLFYYFLCGGGAAVVNVLVEPHALIPVVGASGAIYGLLVAFAMMYPDAVFLVMFIVPLKAKHAVIFFAILELMFSASANTSHVANLAHLGGLATGFLYLKSRTWRYNLRLWKSRLTQGVRQKPSPKPTIRLHELGAEVDRILEKISQQGRSSLTQDEQELLERYSRMKRS
ncbi:MAG: rhomboid family intramembrane serine protease [Elusimicrobia bacterium]|nr:rhomboid family intramembrane serine protease [Elusimicrobiota bacterium]